MVSYQPGTKEGPNAIINASRNLELFYLELGQEIYKIGIHTLSQVRSLNDPEGITRRVYGIAKELLQSDKFIVTLGGEHTLSLGSSRL